MQARQVAAGSTLAVTNVPVLGVIPARLPIRHAQRITCMPKQQNSCSIGTASRTWRQRTLTARKAVPKDDDLGDEFDEDLDMDDLLGEYDLEYEEGELGDLQYEDNPDAALVNVGDMAARFQSGMQNDFDEDTVQQIADDIGDFEEQDQQGQQYAGEEAVQEGKYPEPPERSFFVADLFGWAAFYDIAHMLEEKFPEVAIYGLQNNAERVVAGDMYCCEETDIQSVPQLAQRALSKGAVALLLPSEAQSMSELQGSIPAEVPVFYVDSVDETAARLGIAFFEAPSRDMIVVGVVGNQGKTTTSWLIRGMLEEVQQVVGMVGSIECAIAEDRLDEDGDLWSPREPDPTEERECAAPFMITPYQGKYTLPEEGLSGLHMQKVMSGMRDRGATCAIIEASTDDIQQQRMAWVEVSAVVHTTIGTPGQPPSQEQGPSAAASQEYESLQAALQVFGKLVDPQSQTAVINLDDPYASFLIEAASAVPIVTYSMSDPTANVVIEKITQDIWESELIVRTPAGRLQIITTLLGRHNAYNILAAVATGLALKVPLRTIVAGIEAVEVIPGRSEVVDEGQDFSVVVDNASTPQALEAMLTSVKSSAKRVITVIGCKGMQERSQRPLMAEVAHNLSDIVIFTNDSPALEPPEDIIQDMMAGLPDDVIKRYSGYVYFPFQDQGHVPLWFEPYLQKAQRVTQRYVMEDRFSAIRAAIGTAQAGDVVVIAGRGHCDYMEYADGSGGIVRSWFDDRVEVRNALSKLNYLNQLTRLSRKKLPWGKALEEMDGLIDPPKPSTKQIGSTSADASAAAV